MQPLSQSDVGEAKNPGKASGVAIASKLSLDLRGWNFSKHGQAPPDFFFPFSRQANRRCNLQRYMADFCVTNWDLDFNSELLAMAIQQVDKLPLPFSCWGI